MSQQLIPVSGGVVTQLGTTENTPRLNILSSQYIETFGLQSQPTEWIPGGRPIYHRLPAISETYQINFFNVVTESNLTANNKVRTEIEEIGYVYVPWGESIEGPASLQVVTSESNEALLIKAGAIVWKYGKTEVLPTIVDFQLLEVLSGRYEVAYQLLYDDEPVPNLYEVSDFALTGLPLTVTSSTDNIIGWRYPAVNAFLNNGTLRWSNEDSFFPPYAQPTDSFLQWESDLPQAYSKLTLRCPTGTAYTGTATLSYVDQGVFTTVETVNVGKDTTGQFFEFNVEVPVLQNGWNVTFSETVVSLQSITASGVLTLIQPQSSPSPRAVLVMYPLNAKPKTVTNTQGKEIPATYVSLANIDVDVDFRITNVQDTREIIHRDYVPVSDWLTKPFDSDLIDLYEQVSDYSNLWMDPTHAMKQEYAGLSRDQILVEA